MDGRLQLRYLRPQIFPKPVAIGSIGLVMDWYIYPHLNRCFSSPRIHVWHIYLNLPKCSIEISQIWVNVSYINPIGMGNATPNKTWHVLKGTYYLFYCLSFLVSLNCSLSWDVFATGRQFPRWWFQIFVIFTPILGEMIQMLFSTGFKPPTSLVFAFQGMLGLVVFANGTSE